MNLATITAIRISIIVDVNEKQEESTVRLTLEVGKISDGLVTGTGASARSVSRTSPITAKCNIENNIVLLEVLCDVAKVPSREDGIGSTPRIGGRGTLVGIVRNGLVSEEPNFDRLFVQNVGVNTALFMLTPCP